MYPRILFLLSTITILTLTHGQQAHAQHHIWDEVRVGASVNYSNLIYESEATSLNDYLSYDIGYQLHAHWVEPLSSSFTLQTGIQFYIFTYQFDEISSPETNSSGEPTGNVIQTTITEEFQTAYLSVPVQLRFHLSKYGRIYLLGGPAFSYKVGYKNGQYETALYADSGEKLQEYIEAEYNVPEQANDFLIAASAGLGYDMRQNGLPLEMQLTVKHSLSPYLSGVNHVTSRFNSFAISLSYAL